MDDRWQPRVRRVPALVVPVRVDPSGQSGPTRGQARGPRWRQTSWRFYVPAEVTGEVPEQRILEAYAATDGRGAVTAWASLRLHGAAFFDGLAPDGHARLPVAVIEGSARLRGHVGVQLVRHVVPDDEIVLRHGIRCTTVERALLDEIRNRGEVREAAVAIDMTAAAQLTTLRRMASYLRTRPGARGIGVAAAALELADEHSASPQESRFRLVWVLDAGWAEPLTNRDVFDLTGRFIGRPDLLDPVRGIVGEYAGADHRSRERHRKDVGREDLFRRAGLEYVEVVGADLWDRGLVVGRMRAAERRAGQNPLGWRLGPDHVPLDDVLDQHDAMVAMAQEREPAE